MTCREIGMRLAESIRLRLPYIIIATVMLAMLMVYGGVSYKLSRQGLKEAAGYGLTGFFYVPADGVMRSQDLSVQRRWCMFFAPANWIDQHLFGGPPAIEDLMFRLS